MGTINVTDEQVKPIYTTHVFAAQGTPDRSNYAQHHERKLDDLILSKFVQDSEGLYYNKRQELEIENVGALRPPRAATSKALRCSYRQTCGQPWTLIRQRIWILIWKPIW